MTSPSSGAVCATCEQYAQDITISGPEQLRRIVGTAQTAVAEQKLRIVDDPDKLTDKSNFSALDLSETLPDVLAYRLQCMACGRRFELSCESYHGAGGHWRPA